MKKIYVTLNDYSTTAIDILKSKYEVVVNPSQNRPDEDELCRLVQEYDILIIGAKEKMTETVFKKASKLSTIGTLSIGLDHISDSFLKSESINVISCDESNVISVAEHTFMMLLALMKKTCVSHSATINNTGRKGIGGLTKDISGKTLGVVGAGKIGTKVIKIAQAFDLNVLCFTKNPSNHSDLSNYNVKFVDLEELLRKSDFISFHIPLNIETENILNSSRIDLLKSNSVVINTSRTKLIDNICLSKKLESKQIFGYGLDIDVEEREIIETLSAYDNVLFTPHTAGVTLDAILRMDNEIAVKLTK